MPLPPQADLPKIWPWQLCLFGRLTYKTAPIQTCASACVHELALPHSPFLRTFGLEGAPTADNTAFGGVAHERYILDIFRLQHSCPQNRIFGK